MMVMMQIQIIKKENQVRGGKITECVEPVEQSPTEEGWVSRHEAQRPCLITRSTCWTHSRKAGGDCNRYHRSAQALLSSWSSSDIIPGKSGQRITRSIAVPTPGDGQRRYKKTRGIMSKKHAVARSGGQQDNKRGFARRQSFDSSRDSVPACLLSSRIWRNRRIGGQSEYKPGRRTTSIDVAMNAALYLANSLTCLKDS
jgi:hypothetical protein